MSEPRKLINPKGPEDPSLDQQLLEICSMAAVEAGGYLVPHPEDHSVIVVFGGHQAILTVLDRHHAR